MNPKLAPLVASVLVGTLLIVGCARTTTQRAAQLRPGLTKAETTAFMGPPVSSLSPGNGVEIVRYRLKRNRAPFKVTTDVDYLVRYVDGRIDAYGQADELHRRRIDLNQTPANVKSRP